MARVLFLTQVLPYPLDAGPKVRAYYVLRQLAEEHAVTLVSFVREDDSPEAIDHLAGLFEAVHAVPMQRSRWRDARALVRALLARESIVILRDEIETMQRKLQALVNAQSYDVIHADQTSMAQYALYAREAIADSDRRQAAKTVVDVHNALFRVPQQLASANASWPQRLLMGREARLLEQYERRTYARFDRVVFVSDADRLALGVDLGAAHEPVTIPICIDPDEAPMVPLDGEAQLITHLGTMFWPPNVQGVAWFIREILPLVLQEAPAARLVLI
ncbi:MAG: glycosyltransferase, partial [Anaerolineae bacterium]|nr:glycosyltransferase [Anaerolineae bacterium]